MTRAATPARAAVTAGTIAGVIFATVILVFGVNGLGDGVGALTDALSAFLIAGVIVGGIAAFIQAHRLNRSFYGNPPPGWYDSPENDGMQWYWSGAQWTNRTRQTLERYRQIDRTF